MIKAIITDNGCLNCGQCEDVCPHNSIFIDLNKVRQSEGDYFSIDQKKCVGCLKCVKICPSECIKKVEVK